MAEIAQLSIKMPKLRIALVKVAIRLLSPFVRSEVTTARIGDAMMAWVQRGLRVYANGRRI